MNLEKEILRAIIQEAEKLGLRHHQYHNTLHINNQRKAIRIESPQLKMLEKPKQWREDNKFNPFYVKKNARKIAHSISNKIKQGNYHPFPPTEVLINKSSGGHRKVSIYQIPDAAISTFFYKRLLAKNKHRFSSFSYAYRNDRNAHFAIQDISIELSQSPRLFIAEFDFSKFFDAISHEYLFRQFDENGFFISKEERLVIKAFLEAREKGIPQGTSISLFLANLACWSLDKELEREGVQFARYADDTIIWSNEYSKITKAFDRMIEFSKNVGVDINQEKSEGISIICPKNMPSEFEKSKESVEFLGYSISYSNVSIKNSSVRKIKKEISYILYKHLLQPLNTKPLKALLIPSNNKDEALLSAICEIRRYLYGNLSEDMIHAYIQGRSNRIFFKGKMSFYPLINNEDQLKALDGWLVNAIYKAIQRRAKLLTLHKQPRNHILPFRANKKELLNYCNTTLIKRKRLLKIPSFITIYQAMQKGLVELGVTAITDSQNNHYNY